MDTMSDLNTFVKILTDKGYDGYFLTQGAHAGKLKDSINAYLESCRTGAGSLTKTELLVTSFLQWNGENKPFVQCCMWIKYQKEKFDLSKMEVMKRDRYGLLLKKSEWTNLSAIDAPKSVEAIAMVNDPQCQREVPHRRFRR